MKFSSLFSSKIQVPQDHESQVSDRRSDFFGKATQMKVGDSVLITPDLCESLQLNKNEIYAKLRFCSDTIANNPDGSTRVWRLMCDCIK